MAKRGRPKHIPEAKDKKLVESMTAFGIPQEEICKVIGISLPILHKYYRDEIDTASAKANAKVAQRLYQKAVDEGDTTSLIFWLKTRAGWKEKQVQEVEFTDNTAKELYESLDDSTGLPNADKEKAELQDISTKQSLLH